VCLTVGNKFVNNTACFRFNQLDRSRCFTADKITVLICGAAFLLCLFTGVSNILMIACGVLLALLWVGAKAVTERKGGRP